MDFSSFLGQQSFEHSGKSEGKQIGVTTGDEILRIDGATLEQYYMQDGLAFNIVNKYMTGILRYKGIFKSVSGDEKEQAILDSYALRYRLNSYILPKISQDLPLFGKTWIEKVRDKNTGKILRLIPRDCKYMDISRVGMGMTRYPLVDDYGHPKFYVQYLNYNQTPRDQSRLFNQLGRNCIKFKTDEILRVNLFTLGDCEDGVGVIEPMINALKNKQEVEKATTQSILRIGNPIVYGVVGNDKVFPTKQLIDEVGESLIDINSRTGFAIPNYVQLEMLQAKGFEDMTDNLEYFVDQVVAAGGLPKAIATGGGEGSNKHTLSDVLDFLGGTFNMMKNNIAESFTIDLLEEITSYEGIGPAVFEWEKVGGEQVDTK